jgi:hypothetical protein
MESTNRIKENEEASLINIGGKSRVVYVALKSEAQDECVESH